MLKLEKLMQKDIMKFPFINGRKEVVFKVFAPGAATEFASRFDEYFAYCAKEKMIAPKFVKVARTAAPDKNTVTLKLDKKYKPEIFMDKKGGITVTAPDAMKMDLMIKKLFYRIDQRFPSAIPMPRAGTMGFYKDQVKHFKAEGMVLPYKPFFE